MRRELQLPRESKVKATRNTAVGLLVHGFTHTDDRALTKTILGQHNFAALGEASATASRRPLSFRKRSSKGFPTILYRSNKSHCSRLAMIIRSSKAKSRA